MQAVAILSFISPSVISRLSNEALKSIRGAFFAYSDSAAASFLALITGRDRNRSTESRTLAQAGKELDAGVAVGRLHADLALKALHRKHRVVADAAIGPTGIEAEGGEAALN